MKAGNGYFGEWIIDEFDLPAYKYTCNQLTDPVAKTKTSYGFSTDHFHQLGNDKIIGTAHNGGYVQFLDGSRGFKWLTYRDNKDGKLGGGIGLFAFPSEQISLSDLYNLNNLNKVSEFERIFGMGYYKKKIKIKNVEITHNICPPFSDDPVILSEYVISSNSTDSDLKNSNFVDIVDFWDVNLHPLLKSSVVSWKNRKKFGSSRFLNLVGRFLMILVKIFRRDTESLRRRFAKKFYYSLSYLPDLYTLILTPKYKKKPSVARNQSASKDYYPKSLFLSIINQKDVKFFTNKEFLFKDNEISIDWSSNPEIPNYTRRNLCLSAGVSLNLQDNNQRIVSIFGYETIEKIENLVKKYQEKFKINSILIWNAYQWKNSIISLNIKDFNQISRETIWHSYYTRSALFYDEFYENHRLYQGSVYLFGHGIDGSIRDFVLYLNSLILIDQNLAREFLLFLINLIFKNGKLPYALYGFGKISSVIVHSKPSDLYLFLLWGIEQYISLTRDYGFLEEFVPFYDDPTGIKTNVFDKIRTLINYVFSEKVGFGEHGFIKSNDGDWSDGISLLVKNRTKFKKKGESGFNSTFAVYVIPRVLHLIKDTKKEFINSCLDRLESLRKSILESYNGKWYYRGWDGLGNPIGNQSLYLEHHTWLLISKVLDNQSGLKLIEEIYNILDKPSPIGQYISYPPEKAYLNILPPGWDINGGIWHAMNALLTWAYSLYDEKKAFNSLLKNSLATHAEQYPNIWYGIWSGPDSYLADYTEHPGEAFYHFATPMCDFPIMNLNAHACYLLSVFKIAGIEADRSGLVIDPKLNDREFSFKSPLITIESHLNKFIIYYNIAANEKYHFKIKKPKWWNTESKIYLNKTIYKVEDNLHEQFLDITIPANFGTINIEIINANL